jgi:hypothetical protein
MSITHKVTHTGDGVTTAFACALPASSNSDVKASVAGVAVTAFTLDALGRTATFSVAPANGAAVILYIDTSLTSLGVPVVDPPLVDVMAQLTRSDAYQQRLIDDLRARVLDLETP